MKHKKSLALLASAAMTVSSVAPAFTTVAMAEGTAKYKDGTYSVTKTVTPDEDEDFEEYELKVTFTIQDGAVTDVTAEEIGDGENDSYIGKALNGTSKHQGLKDQIIEKQSADNLDAVSKATCSSEAIKAAAAEALKQAEINDTPDTPVINKTDLQAAVDAVNAANYEESKYTPESWAALQAALTAANEVLANENATQEEVDAAKTALEDAASALEEAPAIPTVDKTALEKAIANAPTEQGNYTDETWTAYLNARTAAQAVLESESATQEAVDAALEALTNAQKALAEKQPDAAKSVYALMNIPYDEFYKAELDNKAKVDAVTSATLNKTRNGGLVAGSYHTKADGSEITGVIYPVKIDASALKNFTEITDDSSVDITVNNRGNNTTTTYSGKDALFESASYSYYILSETPAAYKEAALDENGALSFSEVKTENKQALEEASAELKTSSKYGDYQINVDGLPEDLGNVSAVILETKEGESYGLRHLENIWRKSELAFSTGFTTAAHGSPLQADHYKSIMGKTITGITYVTQNGEYSIPVNLFVPVKTDAEVELTGEAKEGDGSIDLAIKNLPSDFQAVYSVDGLEEVHCENGKLSYKGAKPGQYTLKVQDENGKYTALTAEFTVMSNAAGNDFMKIENGSSNLTSSNANVNIADYVQNITNVTVNGKVYPASGRGAAKLFFENGYLDLTAAPFAGSSVATQDANGTAFAAGSVYHLTIQASGYPDATLTYTVPDTIYAYANLSYGEYWANEAVQAAGDTSANPELDSHNETDKGAFDAVSRATTNHGLHRGSFQQSAVIHTEAGKDFAISHWSADGKTITLTDGSTVGYNRGTITYTEGRTQKTTTLTSYNITGIKYVPVAVSANDFAAFLANRGANYVVVNGGAMAGGYGEGTLSSYTATANVTANTNGLKAATKNADGTFSFGAAKTGTDSGLLGEGQKAASDITVTVKPASGSYGEFLRVDLTGSGYGALGDKMQTVEWTYYGSDGTYTTPVAHYGTKFAADNWMHKAMGIQLGLTKSARCTLPAGTDGTGYWALTVRALGYEDYTVRFEAKAENIVQDTVSEPGDFTALKDLAGKAAEKQESDYTADSWQAFKAELDETNEMITAGTATQAEIDEQITHLQNAMDNLQIVPGNFDASRELAKQAAEKKESNYTSDSWAAFKAELAKLNAMIAAGTAPQSEINAQAGILKAAMDNLKTASSDSGSSSSDSSSSGSSHSSSSSSSTTNNTTNNTTTNNTTVQSAPVNVAGTSPKTGDTSSLLGWMAASLGSIGGLGALIRKRRK